MLKIFLNLKTILKTNKMGLSILFVIFEQTTPHMIIVFRYVMKILVLDDNTSITGALAKYLKLKGQDVTICNDGPKGLNLIKNNKWDRIILDLAMPEVSGLSIIESLETDNKLKDQNITLFTASSVPEFYLEKVLKKEGIKGCLKKPLNLSEIFKYVTA